MKTNEYQAATDARIAEGLVVRLRADLLERVRGCFASTRGWLQAGKYVTAVASDLERCNGWMIAQACGDRSADATQRLLNRAVWDTDGAMSEVRRFAAEGLDAAAASSNKARMRIAALDESGQAKAGTATAGVKRQYMGCAGRVANGINTVHLAYVREKTGHALVGARQWIPAEQLGDERIAAATGLPDDLAFATKGRLALALCREAWLDGMVFDFVCGDEVYGACTELRGGLEEHGQAYVLRVAKSFTLALGGRQVKASDAVKRLLKAKRRWEVRSAGRGSKGQRWYSWAWIATDSPRHYLLVRRHLGSGELAFHYCFVPEGQVAVKARLVRAAGLRWPVEECFEFAKDHFGLDQCQARLYGAIRRHLVLVVAALAICAVTAAQVRRRAAAQAPAPVRPDQAPPGDPGLIPLTVNEIRKIPAAALRVIHDTDHEHHWLTYRRRHQARSAWYHQRTRLGRSYDLPR